MPSQENFFTPEGVDEQLETIERTGQSSMQNRRLLEALSQALCEQKASAALADESHKRMLVSVLSRLLSEEEKLSAGQVNLPPVLQRDRTPLMRTTFPTRDRPETAPGDRVPPERPVLAVHASLSPRRKAPIWSQLGAVFAAVLLVGLFIGTLQLTRHHFAPPTQVTHRGSAEVFEGGSYMIQARDNGDGLPNADATFIIPNVHLAPPWSYELTMTQVQESTPQDNGSSFGLILAYTKGLAYALTFSDEQGQRSVFLYTYNWDRNHQLYHNGQYDSPPYVNQVTPVPGGTQLWASPNPGAFHPGLNVTNTVKIVATAHAVAIFVNGESVVTIPHLSLGSGQFGMFVNTTGTAVRFQNIHIRQG